MKLSKSTNYKTELSQFLILPMTLFLSFLIINVYNSVIETYVGQYKTGYYSNNLFIESSSVTEIVATHLYTDTVISLNSLALMLVGTMVSVGVILIDSKKPLKNSYFAQQSG